MNPRRNIQRKRKARKKMDRWVAGRSFRLLMDFAVAASRVAAEITRIRASAPIPNFKPGGIVVHREGGEPILPETPSRPI